MAASGKTRSFGRKKTEGEPEERAPHPLVALAQSLVPLASRSPPGTGWRARFCHGRQQVLQLYRQILRALRDGPADADRRYLKDWAREEFRRNKDATEEDAIRMMITQGNMQLRELQKTLKLAKS
ncbi:LYR motif-containing protein 2 [Egretta garzetta]|uniref:LYR motif-containing protein 2 n=1 Tax=Egretta garzetta TaxID=188379 RepID=UPI00051F0553|nr:LYR motif-containing protein 2 [Egretta garzetta]